MIITIHKTQHDGVEITKRKILGITVSETYDLATEPAQIIALDTHIKSTQPEHSFFGEISSSLAKRA